MTIAIGSDNGDKIAKRKRENPLDELEVDAAVDIINTDRPISQSEEHLEHSNVNTVKRKEKNYGKDKKIGDDFTLLGSLHQSKKEGIERVLPHWLRTARCVKCSLGSDGSGKEFSTLLDSRIIKILKSDGMSDLFPIQKAVIPEIIKGAEVDTRFRPRDICVATPTGSGKTLAYALSIIQCLSTRNIPAIRAIVILPVKELANQVYDVFCHFAEPFGLRVGKAFGAETFALEQEKLVRNIPGVYRSNVDILIATPGRLSDHISETKMLDFSHLRYLVFDEADQLFFGDWVSLIGRIQRHLVPSNQQAINMAISPCFSTNANKKEDPSNNFGSFLHPFSEDIEDYEISSILPYVPPQRLLFSATLSSNPSLLQNIALYRPLLFNAEREFNANSSIGQYIRPVELIEQYVRLKNVSLKPLILHYVLHKARMKSDKLRALVFTCSIALTNKVAVLLQSMSKGKYTVEAFSKGRGSGREKLVQDFRDGAINVLVSTDAMARGIDLTDIDLVVSFDVPSSTTYIHRIGRTARAGREGKSIALVAEVEFVNFRNATKDVEPFKLEVPQEKLEKYDDRFKIALEALASQVKYDSSKNLPRSLRSKTAGKTKREAAKIRTTGAASTKLRNKKVIQTTGATSTKVRNKKVIQTTGSVSTKIKKKKGRRGGVKNAQKVINRNIKKGQQIKDDSVKSKVQKVT